VRDFFFSPFFSFFFGFVFSFDAFQKNSLFSKKKKKSLQVGTGYFDAVSTVVSAGASSTLALKGSTEAAQFH